MAFDFNQDYFVLFGLPQGFRLDLAQLASRYRQLQGEYHPDRFAAAGDAERRVSLMAATRINEAFQTLKLPLTRARYLLQLRGVDTAEETNTAMPAAFLMQQMEWREAIADAKASCDIEQLEHLAVELRQEIAALEKQLAELLDTLADHAAAALAVRKLRFLEKLDHDLGDAIEALLY